MLFPKISSKYFLAFSLVLSNYWIYKIFSLNFLIGIIVLVVSTIIVLGLKKKLFIVGMLVLTILQIQTTSIKNLSLLDNDEQRVQSERSRSYPLTYIDFGLKVLWLKPVELIEQNKFIIVLSRIEENLFEALDINYYFFGGFPRNTPSDFEKFPFILLPIFLTGVFRLSYSRKFFDLVLLFWAPIGLLSFIGSDNRYGFFILFPFIIYSCIEGINYISLRYKNRKYFLIFLIIFTMLIFLMQIGYAKN